MFIAVEGWSSDLPNDVRQLEAPPAGLEAAIDRGETQGGTDAGVAPERSLSAASLDRWDVQSHQYTTRVEVEASILARLVSGSAKVSNFGLVQEAKRFCIQTTKSGRKIEYGTAVRLSVVIIGAEFDVALTLPNIAAKTQLTDLRARISLSVDGYIGPLGQFLPAPDNLNVENLEVYTTAFKSIQGKVFGVDGLEFISPTLLGYNSVTEKGD